MEKLLELMREAQEEEEERKREAQETEEERKAREQREMEEAMQRRRERLKRLEQQNASVKYSDDEEVHDDVFTADAYIDVFCRTASEINIKL